MLAGRIDAVSQGMTRSQKLALSTNILLYTCGAIGAHDLRTRLAKDYRSDVINMKKSFLDRTSYATVSLWRAFLSRALGKTIAQVVESYGVTERDAALYDMLPVQVKRDLCTRAQAGIPEPISTAVVNEILLLLRPLIAELCRKKLRFVTDHDPAYSVEDFHSALSYEALRVIRKSDSTDPETALERKRLRAGATTFKLKGAPVHEVLGVLVDGQPVNYDVYRNIITITPSPKKTVVEVEYVHYRKLYHYVKRSVKHGVIRLVMSNATQSRARTVANEDRDGYESKVVPLSPVHDTQAQDSSDLDIWGFLEETLNERQLDFINIVDGVPDKTFNLWLKAVTRNKKLAHNTRGADALKGVTRSDVDAVRSAAIEAVYALDHLSIQEYLDAYIEMDSPAELGLMNKAELIKLRKDVTHYATNLLKLDARLLWYMLHLLDKSIEKSRQYTRDMIPSISTIVKVLSGPRG